MVCSCPNCETLMAQAQRGLRSCCVCPQCGATCRACMGAGEPIPPSKPLGPDEREANMREKKEER